MYHGSVIPGFPQHPHRGFETVTIMRNGFIDHSDSLGAASRLGRGDVQWITTGKGIVHSEMFPLLNRDAPNPVDLFQIWLNLARADKLANPEFIVMWDDQVPTYVERDSAGRPTEVLVVAGRLGGLQPPVPPPRSWASRPDSDVAIWTIKMAPHAVWNLQPAPGIGRTLYFFSGSSVRVAGTEIRDSAAIMLRPEAEVTLESGPDQSELLLLQGRPISEPVVQYGPFVMNSREEIQRAFYDYRATGFGGWPWDTDDPVRTRAERRYAVYPDGREERR